MKWRRKKKCGSNDSKWAAANEKTNRHKQNVNNNNNSHGDDDDNSNDGPENKKKKKTHDKSGKRAYCAHTLLRTIFAYKSKPWPFLTNYLIFASSSVWTGQSRIRIHFNRFFQFVFWRLSYSTSFSFFFSFFVLLLWFSLLSFSVLEKRELSVCAVCAGRCSSERDWKVFNCASRFFRFCWIQLFEFEIVYFRFEFPQSNLNYSIDRPRCLKVSKEFVK